VSRARSWLRAHPGLRPLALVVVITAAVALGLRLLMPGTASRPAGNERGLTVSQAPSGSASAARLETPTPDAASLAQAEAVARAFLIAYAGPGQGDSPAALRARLRPYDTDRLDASLGQGGGAGAAATQGPIGLRVERLTSVGLAPDGRPVMVALVSSDASGQGISNRYVELFLARQANGWRVDEVSL
jgi:hypothetical protein